ncbi:NUDIX hydrolase [Falsiroseomonas sp.]|uniref:NUDIX hydrolase n=1 Tax=Falsiroseomonas sp. TaxID=2870721 RepID=UPI003F6F9D2A
MPDGVIRGGRPTGDLRRQCAAVPLTGGAGDWRVVLVTSRETRRWVVPKGWVEPGEEPHVSAAREAFEEAGLEGEAEAEPLGTYSYDKRKANGVLLPCEVLVFRYRVTRLLAEWPERHQRERRLFRPEAAAALVLEPALARLLRSLAQG